MENTTVRKEYLSPDVEILEIMQEGVLCESGNIPKLTNDPNPYVF